MSQTINGGDTSAGADPSAPPVEALVTGLVEGATDRGQQETLLKAGALQSAIFNSATHDDESVSSLGSLESTGVQAYTLLYVEGNPANLMLVEEIMSRRPDIRLLSANDGKSGIELARAAQPDVILMDINLPGISGIAALGILITDKITAHIPVVALSANAIPRDIENGLAAGFFDYLTKPIRVTEFVETLDRALKFASKKSAHLNKNEQEPHAAQ